MIFGRWAWIGPPCPVRSLCSRNQKRRCFGDTGVLQFSSGFDGKMMGKWWENDGKMMGKWCEHAIINHWDFEVWNDWTRHNPCIGWNHKRAMLRYIKRMMHLYASETWSRVTTIIMDISWVTWSRDQPVCGTSGWLLKYGNGNQSLTRSFPQTIDHD